MKRFTLFFALAALAACAPSPVIDRAQDLARTGADGRDGPLGASHITVYAQARVTESVEVEVVYPSLTDGALDRSRGPYPLVLFVHGGLAPFSRYRWIAAHLATRGYVTVAASHFGSLAILQADNSIAALRRVRELSLRPGHMLEGAVAEGGPVIAMGHSLGGVVASWEWVDRSFNGLVLLASSPADGTRVDLRAGSPVLSLSGTVDEKARLADVTRGFLSFSPPRMLGAIDGMNHYAWCDDTSARELSSDGRATRSNEATRTDALRLLDTWLDANVRGDRAAQLALDAGAFPGITVTR